MGVDAIEGIFLTALMVCERFFNTFVISENTFDTINLILYNMLDLIIFLAIGALAGFLGSKLFSGSSNGLLVNMLVGIVGGLHDLYWFFGEPACQFVQCVAENT